MLHSALLKLIALRMRGLRRRMLRGVKTPKGAVFFALGLAMFALWMGPSVAQAIMRRDTGSGWLEAYVPIMMLGMCLLTLVTSAGERAIYFSPGEVDFLFSGPFGRRELLAYKVVGMMIGILFSSVIFSVFFLPHASSWIASFVGVTLALLFIQLFSMALLLTGQMMAEHAYTRLRKAVLLAFGLVLAVALGPALAARGAGNFGEAILQAQQHPALKYALLPLAPFTKTIAASALFPDLLLWASAAAGLNVLLFLFILWLDAEYREAAIGVSQRVYSRMQRAQRSGMAPTGAYAKGRVPQLPYWGGAGPIAWRQLTNALRNAKSVMMVLLLVALAIGIPTVAKGNTGAQIWPIAGGILMWLTVFVSMMIRFDFRMDIEQMDWLKMLPVRPWAMVLGQLAVPVLICSVLQVALVAVTTSIAGHQEWILLAVLFAPPLNLMLFGAENALFLVFPSRVVAFSPGDFQVFGRQLLLILVKMLLLTLALFLAGGLGAVVNLVAGIVPAVIVAWLLMVGLGIAMLPLAAKAFVNFDVSLDTPA